jgi:hypothetical protein
VDIRRIRELVIIAMFADDDLLETLVLKGGNALDIAHQMNLRASVDVDFSMSGDFDDLETIRPKIERSLSERFDAEGYQVFDYKFMPKPSKSNQELPPFWGGYQVEFKIIEQQQYSRLQGDKLIYGAMRPLSALNSSVLSKLISANTNTATPRKSLS